MANIFQNPTHKAQLGYNGFNMSMRNKFTSTVGELLPVYFDILQPGDKVKCFCNINSRTQPVTSAAMCTVNESVDWFFVPMEQIFSMFGSLFYGINDNKTSLVDISNLSPSLPSVTVTTYATLVSNWDTDFTQVDDFGICSSPRLMSMLNIPVISDIQSGSAVVGQCVHFLCAYQKIYNDFYRIEDRQNPDPSSFNLDKYYNIGAAGISSADFMKMCQLRYAPKHKDFFTNTYVSPVFNTGGTSAAPLTHNLTRDFNQWLVDGLNFNTTGPSNTGNIDDQTVVRPSNSPFSSNPVILADFSKYLNPTALRTHFATQKLLEVTRRAGKTYDLQTLAHFGIKPNDSYSDMVRPLGAQHKKVVIGEVIATSDGSTANTSSVLGQVGGRGYTVQGDSNPCSFTADKHGILMAIFHADIDYDYNMLSRYDRLNTYKYMSDWYHPEYDNLGPQPLFNYQTFYSTTDASVNSGFTNWQYRWTELKCKFNQVHGGFMTTLDYWVPAQMGYLYNTLKHFLIDPHSLDDIMLVPYADATASTVDSSPYNLFDTDPLLHDFYFDVVKSSKMNVYSLESL